MNITWEGPQIKELKPIKYWVKENITKGILFDRKEYWLACEFSDIGPFDTREECEKYLRLAESNQR